MPQAFHQHVQHLLLLGARPAVPPAPTQVPPPQRLAQLAEQLRAEQQAHNQQAVQAGQRYRSAFWALYLRAALAVLLAVLPVALGWADRDHPLHRFAIVWGLAELVVILSVWWLYRRGTRENWQGQWLNHRLLAELLWYLPWVAALRRSGTPTHPEGWYADVFGTSTPALPELAAACRTHEQAARSALAGAWSDEGFVREFGRWTLALLAGQRHYHQRVGNHHQALRRRVHRITAALFAITAAAAALHLVWHAPWLLLATTTFPALGAALHGALVQGESHRLADTAARLDARLAQLMQELESALQQDSAQGVYDAAYAALALVLDEHQGWHLLVRPHQLPLG